MAKSRSFSIYLLKETFSAENALKDGHSLEMIIEDNTNLPDRSVMYIADRPGTTPWWKNYWGINKDLYQIQKGALVFLPVDNRWIVLTFGMTHHQLKDNCYEYDFGLRTTLNALDPTKIRSTDVLQLENAKRQRIQSPTASNLNFFDIRQNESIIKKLTGSVKAEYNELFKNATGASSLRISSNSSPEQIIDLCRTLIEIYNRTDYIQSFPDIQNIVPVKDPDKINELNQKLLEAFVDAPVELVLAIPDIIDYSESFKVKYIGAGRSSLEFDDVFIGGYRQYLQEKDITDIDDINLFHRHQISVLDENNNPIRQYNIYKGFLFDCELNDLTYHLCEGEWYFIETSFIQKLSNSLNPYFVNDHHFLHPCSAVREDDYNISVEAANQDVICLDKENISLVGQSSVEPCDLISLTDGKINLIHIKISTRSASLSHLFNQGVNSIELLRIEQESRNKLKILVNSDDAFSHLIDRKEFSVTYGIITKKFNNNLGNRSKNLPIFSRISLLRTVNMLEVMNIPCSVYFIQDNVNRRGNMTADQD
jgi:uncharacterized protein (TIGR04141 family)